MYLTEITIGITLGLLILSELRYQIMKSIDFKDMETEKIMLKGRIATLEHEVQIRDDLLNALEVIVHESASSSSSQTDTRIHI
jgi:hypothetical protein